MSDAASALTDAHAALDALERQLPPLLAALEAVEPHRVALQQSIPILLDGSFRGEIESDDALALLRRLLALNRTLTAMNAHAMAMRTLAETPTKGSA